MSEITIDEQQALDLMRRAVAEKGTDYVYVRPDRSKDCVYVDTTVDPAVATPPPSCLVGHALVYAGVDPVLLWEADQGIGEYVDDEYGEVEKTDDTSIKSSGFNQYLSQHGVALTYEARRVFGAAQREQDRGIPWGQAVAYAARELESV